MIFLPARFACRIQLSSKIAVLAKLLPASMNVGSVPVVRALRRCKVVVGGSALNWKRSALDGRVLRRLCKMGNLLM